MTNRRGWRNLPGPNGHLAYMKSGQSFAMTIWTLFPVTGMICGVIVVFKFPHGERRRLKDMDEVVWLHREMYGRVSSDTTVGFDLTADGPSQRLLDISSQAVNGISLTVLLCVGQISLFIQDVALVPSRSHGAHLKIQHPWCPTKRYPSRRRGGSARRRAGRWGIWNLHVWDESWMEDPVVVSIKERPVLRPFSSYRNWCAPQGATSAWNHMSRWT